MTDRDRIQYLFEVALELPPSDREAFLQRECGGDKPLRDELRALLAGDAAASGNPAWQRPGVDAIMPDIIGQKIGPYRVEAAIGAGGMGKVYRAVRSDSDFRQKAAIKLIRFGEDTEHIVQRFRNERQILASLEHPNIARLLDGGTAADGRLYFAMEYVDGEPLDRWSEKQKPDVARRLDIFRQICSAVQYAHQRMVIHRDLKPGNILVTTDGTPKLVDFGISKLLEHKDAETATATMTGMRMMTPRYASPEQVQGKPVTTASDVYSLGVVLYELLTDRSPYTSPTAPTHEVMRAVCEEEPAKPSSISPVLRGDLDNIVLMALRKDPARRYASADQFSEDIRRYEDGYPVIARPDTRRYRAIRFMQRNRIGVAAAAVTLVVLIAGIAATAWEAHVANQRYQDVRHLAHSVVFDYDDAAARVPGNLALRTRLVKDGLDYLDRLSVQARGDRDLQIELAGGYLKVGDVQAQVMHANVGDAKGGLLSYQKAIGLLEDVTRKEPRNEEAAEELAIAYQRLGELKQQSGDPRSAMELLNKGIAIYEKLCSTGQYASKLRLWSNVVNDRRAWLAPMYGALARAVGEPVGASMGDAIAAEKWYRKELAMYESIGKEPRLLVSVGAGHSYLGGLLTNAGKNREALDEYKKALAIDQDVIQLRSDPVARRELAIAYHNVGVGYLGTQEYEPALASFRNAMPILDALVAADPNDVNIRVNMADNTRRIGETQFRMKAYDAGAASLRQAIAIYEAVLAKNPKNMSANHRLGLAALLQGQLYAEIQDGPTAVAAAQKAASLFASEGPENKSGRQMLARSYFETGRGYEVGGNWHTARDWYARSVELWHDIVRKGQLSGFNAKRPSEAEQALAAADRHLKM